MVTADQVNGAKTEVDNVISKYTEANGNLSGKWDGDSFNKYNTSQEAYSKAFKSEADSKFQQYSEACTKYQDLITADDAITALINEKKELEAKKAEEEAKKAAAEDEIKKADYAKNIAKLEQQIADKEVEINEKKEKLKAECESVASSAQVG